MATAPVQFRRDTVDLDYAENLLNTKGPVAMYSYLETQGSKYATLALGITRDPPSFAGQAALDHMQTVAKESTGQELSQEKIDKIMFEMAEAYLETLRNKQRNGDFFEITADEATDFHDPTFKINGLPKEAWTLSIPFTAMTKLSQITGDVQYKLLKEELWRQSYHAAGDSNLEKKLGVQFMSITNDLRNDLMILSRKNKHLNQQLYDVSCQANDQLDNWQKIQQKNSQISDFVLKDGSLYEKGERTLKGAVESYRDWENDRLNICPLSPTWDKSVNLRSEVEEGKTAFYKQVEDGIPNTHAIRQRTAGIALLLSDDPSLDTFIDKFNPEEASRILTYAAFKTIERKDTSLDEVYYSTVNNTLDVFSEYRGFTVPAEKVAQQSIPDIAQNHDRNMAELEQQRQTQQLTQNMSTHKLGGMG